MLPTDFYDLLHSLIESHTPQSHLQGIINFMHDEKAQADVVIAARVTRKLTDMIVSTDTDYAAYLGNRCTCLKDFTYNVISNTISEIVLSTAAEIETYRWLLVLDWEKNDEKPLLLLQKPQFPIFGCEDDPNIRSVCAVAMGCDMWPGGIKSCGSSNIKKHLDELTGSDENRAMCLAINLLKTYKTFPMNENTIYCFAYAFLYEISILYGYIYMDINLRLSNIT